VREGEREGREGGEGRRERKQWAVFIDWKSKKTMKEFLTDSIFLSQHSFPFLCLSHKLNIHSVVFHQEQEKQHRWEMGPSGQQWSVQTGHRPST
jgi:hypothetical protein